MHSAAARNMANCVLSLLNSSSINVNSRDKHGRTALYAACYRGNIEAAAVLVKDRRVDLNKTYKLDHRRTVFHQACLTSKDLALRLADVPRMKVHMKDVSVCVCVCVCVCV